MRPCSLLAKPRKIAKTDGFGRTLPPGVKQEGLNIQGSAGYHREATERSSLKDIPIRVYKKSEFFVFRKIADECLLVPIGQNVADLESIFTLNEVASRIWELIDGKTDIQQIKARIAEEFEVTPEIAEKDLKQYLRQLEKIKAISKV
jgi:hypothetical protein